MKCTIRPLSTSPARSLHGSSVLKELIDAVDVPSADGAALVLCEQLVAALVAAETVTSLPVPDDAVPRTNHAHGTQVVRSS